VAVAAAGAVLTADFRLIRGLWDGSRAAGLAEGPVAREWRAQAGDRIVHDLMASARNPEEFSCVAAGAGGRGTGRVGCRVSGGYGFYVRRNLWLPRPLSTAAEATLVPGLQRPWLLIVLPYPRFAGRAAALFEGHSGRPPGRLLLYSGTGGPSARSGRSSTRRR